MAQFCQVLHKHYCIFVSYLFHFDIFFKTPWNSINTESRDECNMSVKFNAFKGAI